MSDEKRSRQLSGFSSRVKAVRRYLGKFFRTLLVDKRISRLECTHSLLTLCNYINIEKHQLKEIKSFISKKIYHPQYCDLSPDEVSFLADKVRIAEDYLFFARPIIE